MRFRSLLVLLCVTTVGRAQQAANSNAISSYLLQSYTTLAKGLTAVVTTMPGDDFAYRPPGVAAEVRTFGQIVAHVAYVTAYSCEMGDGKAVPVRQEDTTIVHDKARLLALLSETDARCIAYLSSLSDSALADILTRPAGERELQAVRANSIIFAIAHANEHYGNLVTYLRTRGLVPPRAAAQKVFLSLKSPPPKP